MTMRSTGTPGPIATYRITRSGSRYYKPTDHNFSIEQAREQHLAQFKRDCSAAVAKQKISNEMGVILKKDTEFSPAFDCILFREEKARM